MPVNEQQARAAVEVLDSLAAGVDHEANDGLTDVAGDLREANSALDTLRRYHASNGQPVKDGAVEGNGHAT